MIFLRRHSWLVLLGLSGLGHSQLQKNDVALAQNTCATLTDYYGEAGQEALTQTWYIDDSSAHMTQLSFSRIQASKQTTQTQFNGMLAVFSTQTQGDFTLMFDDGLQEGAIFESVGVPPNEIISTFAVIHSQYVQGLTFTTETGTNFSFSTQGTAQVQTSPQPEAQLTGRLIGFSFRRSTTNSRLLQVAVVVNSCRRPADVTLVAGSSFKQLLARQSDLQYTLSVPDSYPLTAVASLSINALLQDQLELKSTSFTADVGIHRMTLVVDMLATQTVDVAYSFQVTVLPCHLDSLSSSPVTTIRSTVTVGDPQSTIEGYRFTQLIPECPGFEYPHKYLFSELPSFVKAHADSSAFTVTQFTDNSLAGVHVWNSTYSVSHQTAPEGGYNPSLSMTLTRSFEVQVLQNCAAQIVTAPEMPLKQVTYVLNTSSTVTSFTFPEFSFDMSERCSPLTYTLVAPAPLFVNFENASRKVSWAGVTQAQRGVYKVTLKGTGPMGSSATASFELHIDVACVDAVLSIDPSIVPFVVTYRIGDPKKEIKIDKRLFSSSHSSLECIKPLFFSVTKANGAPLDSRLMTVISDVLVIQTDDLTGFLDNLTHNLKIRLYYFFLFPSPEASHFFTVQLDHVSCEPSGPITIADYTVMLGQPYEPLQWTLPKSQCGELVLQSHQGLALSQGSATFSKQQLLLENLGQLDKGTYTAVLTFTINKTPVLKEVAFIVTVQECVQTSLVPSLVQPQVYEVYSQAILVSFQEFKQVPVCSDALTYTISVRQGDSAQIATPQFLRLSGTQLEVLTSDRTAAGKYTVVVQASDARGVLREEALFIDLEIKDPCPSSSFDVPANDFSTNLRVPEGQSSASFSFSPVDSVSSLHKQSFLCGQYQIAVMDATGSTVFTPALPNIGIVKDSTKVTFLVRSETTGQVKIEEALLRVSLVEFPQVPALEKPIQFQYLVKQKEADETRPIDVDPTPTDDKVVPPDNSDKQTPKDDKNDANDKPSEPKATPDEPTAPEIPKEPETPKTAPESPSPAQRDDTSSGESGFEAPFDLRPLDPIDVSCNATGQHELAPVEYPSGLLRPYEVHFDELTAQFASFDNKTQTLFTSHAKLRPIHEGTHIANVTVAYGKGKFASVLNQTLELRVFCYSDLAKEEQALGDDKNQTEAGLEPSRSQPTAEVSRLVIPSDQIHAISEFEVRESSEMGQWDAGQPIPQLESVSENGLILISWDREMVIPSHFEQIAEKQYVIVDDVRRLRRDRQWFDTDGEYLRYLLIVDALEIRVFTHFDDGEVEDLVFTWSLVAFEARQLKLQLLFERPELLESRFAQDKIRVTFWGTEFFKSKSQLREVQYGRTIEARVLRQQTMLDGERSLHQYLQTALATVLISSLLFLWLPGSNLLPTWLLILTVQVLAHLILLPSFVPNPLYVCLRALLQFVRLSGEPSQVSIQEAGLPMRHLMLVGYTSDEFLGNITAPFIVLGASSLGIFAVIMISQKVHGWVNRTQQKSQRKCLRVILDKTAPVLHLVYLSCAFEVSLCALIPIGADSAQNTAPWLALGISSLILIAPVAFLWTVDSRVAKLAQTNNDAERRNLDDSESPCDGAEQATARSLLSPALRSANHAEGLEQQYQCCEGGQNEKNNAVRLARLLRKKQGRKIAHQILQAESEVKQGIIDSLYYGRKVTRAALLLPVMFAGRAVAFSIAIVCIQDCSLQLITIISSQLVYFCLMLHWFASLWTSTCPKLLQVIHETSVLVFAVAFTLFTPFVDSLHARSQIGYFLLGHILLLILLNLVIVLQTAFTMLKLVSRWCIAKERRQRSLRELKWKKQRAAVVIVTKPSPGLADTEGHHVLERKLQKWSSTVVPIDENSMDSEKGDSRGAENQKGNEEGHWKIEVQLLEEHKFLNRVEIDEDVVLAGDWLTARDGEAPHHEDGLDLIAICHVSPQRQCSKQSPPQIDEQEPPKSETISRQLANSTGRFLSEIEEEIHLLKSVARSDQQKRSEQIQDEKSQRRQLFDFAVEDEESGSNEGMIREKPCNLLDLSGQRVCSEQSPAQEEILQQPPNELSVVEKVGSETEPSHVPEIPLVCADLQHEERNLQGSKEEPLMIVQSEREPQQAAATSADCIIRLLDQQTQGFYHGKAESDDFSSRLNQSAAQESGTVESRDPSVYEQMHAISIADQKVELQDSLTVEERKGGVEKQVFEPMTLDEQNKQFSEPVKKESEWVGGKKQAAAKKWLKLRHPSVSAAKPVKPEGDKMSTQLRNSVFDHLRTPRKEVSSKSLTGGKVFAATARNFFERPTPFLSQEKGITETPAGKVSQISQLSGRSLQSSHSRHSGPSSVATILKEGKPFNRRQSN